MSRAKQIQENFFVREKRELTNIKNLQFKAFGAGDGIEWFNIGLGITFHVSSGHYLYLCIEPSTVDTHIDVCTIPKPVEID